MNYCLKFEDVSKDFNLRLLYKNVNFTLFAGDIILLTGKNGSGKSTLLKLASDLAKPSKGKITCPMAKEDLAYLGHNTFLYPQLTAYENLEFWTRTLVSKEKYPKLEQKILENLKRVNLHKFAHDTVNIFSRGMAQRLNIARILLQDPKFLLLDEPATGLDTESKSIFYACIEEFKAKNTCILWVSHDLEADKQYATKLMRIENKSVYFQSNDFNWEGLASQSSVMENN